MTGTRGAAMFLLLVSLAGAVPGPVPVPTHRPLAHNTGFPPLDDDDTREPAILDESEEADDRAP